MKLGGTLKLNYKVINNVIDDAADGFQRIGLIATFPLPATLHLNNYGFTLSSMLNAYSVRGDIMAT